MDFLNSAWSLVVDRLEAAFNLNSPYGPIALGGTLIFAALYYIDIRGKRGRKASLTGFVRFILPARILKHHSTRLDLGMWIANAMVLASTYALFVVSGFFWRQSLLAALEGAFGPHEPTAWPVWAILALVTFVELLAYELGYWLCHYAFHAIPALWEFHKVHHTAEVLTPLTEMRTHPFELLVTMNVIGFCTGVVFGVMTYAFGPGVRPFTLLNANAALMLFIVTIGHLRHSHMWIPLKGFAGKLFQSPAHHQIHHSDQPRHFNKNLGYCLAIWDWLFGTLYVPQTHERIVFGVGARHVEFDSLLRAFALPFASAAAQLGRSATAWRARWRRAPAADAGLQGVTELTVRRRSVNP